MFSKMHRLTAKLLLTVLVLSPLMLANADGNKCWRLDGAGHTASSSNLKNWNMPAWQHVHVSDIQYAKFDPSKYAWRKFIEPNYAASLGTWICRDISKFRHSAKSRGQHHDLAALRCDAACHQRSVVLRF